MRITIAHGSGGKATSELIDSIFARYFHNPILARMEDAASVDGFARLAMTTDSFVVTPRLFPGGDIGRLSICGTVNDLAMSGAVPRYLTCGFILEEGCDTDELVMIAKSMRKTADEAGVIIVAGDTKVVEGNGNIYINTSGVGFLDDGTDISSSYCKTGDAVLVSGTMGEHHAAILSSRMGIKNDIISDCAPLTGMVEAMKKEGLHIHAMRDVTRGGLATVLNEFAIASQVCIELNESQLPVSTSVKGLCMMLGLDAMYMGNEGKLTVVLPADEADRAVECMRQNPYGQNAAVIGKVTNRDKGIVIMNTELGGTRVVSEMYGEGLPRIC